LFKNLEYGGLLWASELDNLLEPTILHCAENYIDNYAGCPVIASPCIAVQFFDLTLPFIVESVCDGW